jgi:pantoate--beta-alanine ligase
VKKRDLKMLIISKIDEIRKLTKEWKADNLRIGFVPTMGALHEGHKSLIKKAHKSCDRIVVSIFVNPTQFGPTEDFDKYPRTLEKDREACLECGADAIFVPNAKEMYPDFTNLLDKKNLTLLVPPETFAKKLCGNTRTGHFDGVATVVLKFFNIVRPDKAFFGQKDAQQLAIIKKMIKDLNLEIEIISCPIIREENGLALSSRNSYLSAQNKNKACSLHKVLEKVVNLYNEGEKEKKAVFEKALYFLDKDFELEYLEACDLETLENVEILRENTLILIAAKISNIRLIDNEII